MDVEGTGGDGCAVTPSNLKCILKDTVYNSLFKQLGDISLKFLMAENETFLTRQLVLNPRNCKLSSCSECANENWSVHDSSSESFLYPVWNVISENNQIEYDRISSPSSHRQLLLFWRTLVKYVLNRKKIAASIKITLLLSL